MPTIEAGVRSTATGNVTATRAMFVRVAGFALAWCMVMGVAGCSDAPRAAKVDATQAHTALRSVLDAWKGGKSPADLQSGSPAITAQDLDWLGGAVLVGYEVIGDGTDDDANLRIPVALTLRGADGRQVEKRVSYVVGTSPKITVFREL